MENKKTLYVVMDLITEGHSNFGFKVDLRYKEGVAGVLFVYEYHDLALKNANGKQILIMHADYSKIENGK